LKATACRHSNAKAIDGLRIFPYLYGPGEFDNGVWQRCSMRDHRPARLKQSIGGLTEACDCLRTDDYGDACGPRSFNQSRRKLARSLILPHGGELIETDDCSPVIR
jgi:hypothetical protein